MNRQIFTSLPINKRCDYVWDEGQFLDSVQYYRYKANLYAVRDFFVEVLCFPGSTEVEKIEIASEDTMIKFLNRINVENLLDAE
jgi:hypothetical protein